MKRFTSQNARQGPRFWPSRCRTHAPRRAPSRPIGLAPGGKGGAARRPGGVFTAGAGVKTNLLLFTKGQPTEQTWYYDLSDVKVGKTTPMTLDRFADFFRLLPGREDSERSWTITRADVKAKNYDLKAVNPNAKADTDTRTPEELLDIIAAKGAEVEAALATLRAIR